MTERSGYRISDRALEKAVRVSEWGNLATFTAVAVTGQAEAFWGAAVFIPTFVAARLTQRIRGVRENCVGCQSDGEIDEETAERFTNEAKTMWSRAVIIVGNETKEEVALAVISSHLSGYKAIPYSFIVDAVDQGVEKAYQVESEIKQAGIENSDVVKKAMLAKKLLREAGIVF